MKKKLIVKKLFEILELIGETYSTSWKQVMNIVDCFSEITVISKKWGDRYKNDSPDYYSLDLSDIKTWSTYDSKDCIELKFRIENNKLHCDASVWNGDMLDGRRTDLRFIASLILPNKFIINIEGNIMLDFDYYLELQYDKFLKDQKNAFINDLKEKILKH